MNFILDTNYVTYIMRFISFINFIKCVTATIHGIQSQLTEYGRARERGHLVEGVEVVRAGEGRLERIESVERELPDAPDERHAVARSSVHPPHDHERELHCIGEGEMALRT